MQYILNEAEYAALKAQITAAETKEKDKVQKLCSLVASYKPVARDWSDDKTPKPWGCIRNEEGNPGYCDDCPVDHECPYEHKEWSQ